MNIINNIIKKKITEAHGQLTGRMEDMGQVCQLVLEVGHKASCCSNHSLLIPSLLSAPCKHSVVAQGDSDLLLGCIHTVQDEQEDSSQPPRGQSLPFPPRFASKMLLVHRLPGHFCSQMAQKFKR